jgi:hypothetical protein
MDSIRSLNEFGDLFERCLPFFIVMSFVFRELWRRGGQNPSR